MSPAVLHAGQPGAERVGEHELARALLQPLGLALGLQRLRAGGGGDVVVQRGAGLGAPEAAGAEALGQLGREDRGAAPALLLAVEQRAIGLLEQLRWRSGRGSSGRCRRWRPCPRRRRARRAWPRAARSRARRSPRRRARRCRRRRSRTRRRRSARRGRRGAPPSAGVADAAQHLVADEVAVLLVDLLEARRGRSAPARGSGRCACCARSRAAGRPAARRGSGSRSARRCARRARGRRPRWRCGRRRRRARRTSRADAAPRPRRSAGLR